jgi:hypothetical protein
MAKQNQRVVTIEVTIEPQQQLTDEQVNDLLLIKSKDKTQVKVKCYGIAEPQTA